MMLTSLFSFIEEITTTNATVQEKQSLLQRKIGMALQAQYSCDTTKRPVGSAIGQQTRFAKVNTINDTLFTKECMDRELELNLSMYRELHEEV